MTPASAFVSVLVPADLAEAFENRAWEQALCAEEVLIRLLSHWVNELEPKVQGADLPGTTLGACDVKKDESVFRLSGLRYGNKLRRCRNCGIRVPKALRILPWKACSEDCADELWLKANTTDAELY
ncbi:hypothetical protein NVV95_03065 [Herbiconiux sp. CPCC 205716]|uniref:Uncharacterized protein n=1 Tax=Herbiconiux gentiana TaxID=2970912 RepID=A0ABT2GBE2_9MICO|nr:hypothetical protein [Herbiconiux gentiana]MCS5713531.1 hypothetical protein [Herbiconiux gentiana]